MRRRMLIESDPYETRVAVLEDDRLVEIYVERHRSRGLVGNIYKGRVKRVLAGMQAAFVDIGLERDAFLYVGDAEARDVPGEEDEEAEPASRSDIRELVAEGEEILVQVEKDPLPRKGARLTTRVALPGRFLVLLPLGDRAAVSRRIDEAEERERLLGAVAGLGESRGLIVRTAAEGRGVDDLAEDHAYLSELWSRIEAASREAKAPSLLHAEHEPALRLARDLVDESFADITVQGGETFRRVVTFFDRVQPALAQKVREAPPGAALFEDHDLESQLDAALRSKVWLKSGGYLIINPTEALVAIDVNTGRFVGGRDLEETVFKTNLEAVREVARQIRLRDLGGIIVVDFIDMERAENGRAVLEELQRELSRDRSRSRVLALSDFGLVEITRKRSRANLRSVLTEACPDCLGQGRIKSATTICLEIRREVLAHPESFADRDPLLIVHPVIEEALNSSEREVLADIEQSLGKKAVLRTDTSLLRDQFEVLTV